MTRDYAKRTRRPSGARNTRHQPSRKTLPGWLWMVGGVLVGALVMTVADHIRSPAPEESVVEPEPVAVDDDAPKPRFDFYTLLKESEVIVPDEETAPAPPVAMPLPTNPDTENATAADTKPTEPAAGQLPSVAATATQLKTQPPDAAIAEAKPTTAPKPEATAAPRTEEKPAPEVAATPPPPPPQPAPPREVYLLQAGSFKSASDADTLRVRLLLLNMQARVETVSPRPGETWHRVQVGPFNNTQSLSSARSVLQQNGIASIQVKKTR
ncbi:MAG: SPOR domain-containing protein [Porticoccaceae bacterium]|jgi:cell division protein FtsN|nr:SPOR domain-containing protein [Porticoccaceae bacterium]HLS97895.1 SPOR domain-containing protein [Porticoccaceae bacterium]